MRNSNKTKSRFISATRFPILLRSALVVAIILLPAMACTASAADIYFANSTTGSNNGTSCANAYAYNDGTHGINGSQTASWVAGNTLHICGTITGAAGDQAVSINGSGSPGNPITVKFEAGAVLTAPYWGGIGGAITAGAGAANVTIDGGTNGIIQNTQNGVGLAYQVNSHGVFMQGGLSNVIIKNLTVSNICYHDTSDSVGVNCTTGGNDAAGIYVTGAKTNVIITRNTVHDAGICIRDEAATGDTGVSIDHNTVSRCNWGINLGNGTSTGTQVTNNDISCVVGAVCNWDTGLANAFHHNGIMFDPQAAGSLWNGTVFANNYIHDVNPSTAYIFPDPLDFSFITNTQIYNNVFYTTGTYSSSIGPQDAFTGGTGLVANNTMVGPAAFGFGGHPGDTGKNNIISGTQSAVLAAYPTSSMAGFTSDYNVIYNTQTTLVMCADNPGNNCFPSVAAFTAVTGQESHSITSNPNLTPSFTLSSGSSAIGKGANLTNLGIAGLTVGAPQTFGVGGSCGTGCVPRPSSGAWDIGAYQYGTGTVTQTPDPPTGLTALVQ